MSGGVVSSVTCIIIKVTRILHRRFFISFLLYSTLPMLLQPLPHSPPSLLSSEILVKSIVYKGRKNADNICLHRRLSFLFAEIEDLVFLHTCLA